MFEPDEINQVNQVSRPAKPFMAGIVGPVTIPLLQSIITGFLAGLCALALVLAAGAPVNALAAGGVVFVLVTFGSWMVYRGRWQWVIEQYLGVDLNHDGFIGEPEPGRVEPVRVEIVQDGGRQVDFLNLPCPEKIPLLAAGLLQGRAFAQSVWTGQGALFTRNEFETIRAELLKRGLVRWRKEGAPGQGVDLTPAGRAVFKRLAESSPALLPAGKRD